MLEDERDLIRAADGMSRMAALVSQPEFRAILDNAEFVGLCSADELSKTPEERVYRWMRCANATRTHVFQQTSHGLQLPAYTEEQEVWCWQGNSRRVVACIVYL